MAKKDKTLNELIEDLKEFNKDYWVAPKGKIKATRHITIHLGKLLGKISGVVHDWDHGFEASDKKIKEEVVPDLLIYAMHLALIYDIDLAEAYFKRQEANRKKVKSWNHSK